MTETATSREKSGIKLLCTKTLPFVSPNKGRIRLTLKAHSEPSGLERYFVVVKFLHSDIGSKPSMMCFPISSTDRIRTHICGLGFDRYDVSSCMEWINAIVNRKVLKPIN